jgi:hypothetical protein
MFVFSSFAFRGDQRMETVALHHSLLLRESHKLLSDHVLEKELNIRTHFIFPPVKVGRHGSDKLVKSPAPLH